ncbi:MAG: tRNA (adenosine(37)-N6)-dimethylallyltransferase MiaA [Alphaproteobacteria bacterium]|nr:tRNA (adenosine(37)-N6)-dimethylallyltransferase MiaA [Alphaproteobacteria bacterium]MBU1515502.1 tRNA (adenosine(37)-N6)-dimethylallyltransferase MiaA [Alphaproteobacteria bacterium]MBU2095500.1 tRNA (adenosine(37)-N6)-dimethylallyltransferase MiaA [Alphaproteobacteria bacterium]MBU2150741.1 tRNA (adenosine(37)-N6)-dimethylallyltransferase MiaA [Alphaproteobacteria bacterium]MBU2307006.1 tRNA (adenosine(37)-N6)-dimethylallyltransferase MiaA [Alphaproteobacteria bacterium]
MTGRIWLIAGPTASGKSALGQRLARATGGEIVNADSMQLYAGLQVLSAGPGPEELAAAPHHLFGTVDAADGWSVGRWLRAASDVIVEIGARGRDAIVVGGTGLYFSALTKGLAEIPQVPAEVRRVAATDFDDLGEGAFRARLAEIDPAAAARIAAGDRQRLARAWEVFAATGTSLTDHQASASGALPAGSWTAVALEPPRAALYARCDARLDGMIADGALDEVAALMARKLDPTLPAMKAVGVRELSAHLRGETGLAQAIAAAQQETRRYAKRQMTWMRGQMSDWPRLDAAEPRDQWRQLLALEPALTP